MRNDVPRSFVLACAVLSVHAAYLKDSASSRNSLVNDASPSDQKSSSFLPFPDSAHECLYISPDLPICDFERMQEVEEDVANSAEDSREASSYRARRSNEDRPSDGSSHSERQVIVYTIEGCLPPRLPFRMPSCQEESSRGKIVEVRKLYPFTVKGLKEPPLVFPEFNFDRWMRTMKRLQYRTSSTANTEMNLEGVPNLERNSDLSDDASTKKSITPNKLISSEGPSKGSSPNDILPYDKSHGLESPGTKKRTEDLASRGARMAKKIDERRKESRDVHDSPSELVAPRPKTQKLRKTGKSEMYTKKAAHGSTKPTFSTKDSPSEKTKSETRVAKPEASQETHGRVINYDEALNDFPIAGDSNDFRETNEDLGGFDDLTASSRGRRDVRRTAGRTTRGIHREAGIPGKSIVKRSRKLRETAVSRGNGLDVHGERNKFSDGHGSDFESGKHGVARQEGTTRNEAAQMIQRDTMEDFTQVSRTISKSSLDKISSRKKYGKYTKFGSKRDE